MLFNFHFGNQAPVGLNSFADLLLPIQYGLIEAGHEVIGFGTEGLAPPAVNLFTENFTADFTDALLKLKADNGDRFIFGVLCAEDMSDPSVVDRFPGRRESLIRILPVADFVWTLKPQPELFSAVCRPENVALMKYGFTRPFLDPYPIRDPSLRDVDVIVYGTTTAYREPIVDGLKAAGLACFGSEGISWPNFITDDIIRRAKVLVDMRRSQKVRYLSPTRICRALHSGAAIVSEQFDTSEIADLYRYASPCAYGEITDRCIEIIRSRRFVEIGFDALARFQRETSMRENVEHALKLPVFKRLEEAASRQGAT